MGKQPKILVVDDDKYLLGLYSISFRPMNCRVEIANNGYEAVELYKVNDYKLIITDLSMPVMDGATASNLIRTIAMRQNRPQIPIILVSANDPGDYELWESVVHSADVVMAKPLDFDELHRVIRLLADVGTTA